MSLVDPTDPLERQVDKLTRIAQALMRRVERSPDAAGAAYAQFERAALLEAQVRARTDELERTLDLLQESNARLADATREAERARSDLAQAIETVEEGFALFDPQDRLVLHNSRFCVEMPDVAEELRAGLSFSDYVALVSRSAALASARGPDREDWRRRRLARHEDARAQFDVRLTGERWMQVSERRTADGGTVILQTDVTPIVRREHAERARLIDRQAQLTRATLDHLAQGVCSFDRAGRLLGWNAQMEAILSGTLEEDVRGLGLSRLLDRVGGTLSFSGKGDRDRLEDWASRPGRRGPLRLELSRGDARSGATYALSAREMPDRGFVISFADVTAERRANAELESLAATLEQRVAARTEELGDALEETRRATAARARFLAAASHDLLQPLSAAKLFVGAIEDRAEPDLRAIAGKAISALGSVETILESLLDLARLDSAHGAPTIGSVPLGPLLAGLAGEMAPLADARGIALRVVAPHRARVRSDPVWLRRIVQNLLANAVRHTDGTRVLLGARRLGGAWRIEVHDEGPGIPPQDQEAIFAEFSQLEAGRARSGGLGLGLSIVERACSMLGHEVGLRSEPGRGSRFSVRVAEMPGAQGRADAAGPRADPRISAAVVLLVEDDPEVAESIALIVEGWGADVIQVESGEAALDLIEELAIVPDAVLLDLSLAGALDGFATLEALVRAHGPLPACIVTAARDATLAARCGAVGAALLAKPPSRKALAAFLSRAVAARA